MSQVFISYARDGSYGEQLAGEIHQQFKGAGITVFRDVVRLKPGDVWFHKLEFELKSSDLMVLVMSEKARTSKWVHNEFSMAEEIGIPVIPVLAESIRRPLWLRHLQVIDFCQQQKWDDLLKVVKPHLELVSEPKSPPKAQEDNKAAKSVSEANTSSSIILPEWASKADKDQYGRYADLNFKDVVQRFRWIEPGTFWMGSPESEAERYYNQIRHQVTLSKGYWLADTACTQALWKVVMGNNPASFKDNVSHPVEQVSWDVIHEFLESMNSEIPALKARLPTEAEWEYACRAGTNTPFSFGENITPELVNYYGDLYYADGSKGQFREKTVAVTSLPANPWGLYEMHGNVWEWCQDRYGNYSNEQATDPQGAETGAERVIRGGSWGNDGRFCRSAFRDRYEPDFRSNSLGFRLVFGH